MTMEIRKAKNSEMQFFIESAAKEGWNPGLNDGEVFYQTNPEGFFIAFEKGNPIGCISAVSYGTSFGFMGFYIVIPSQRGQGIGLKLWQTAMSYLQDKTIGLDGVVSQQENYKKSGFVLDYKNVRFKGSFHSHSKRILPTATLEKVANFDQKVFGLNRFNFLKNWLNMPNSHSALLEDPNQGFGYGVIRECREGYKIGPLFAETAQGAKTIFESLVIYAKHAPVFIDSPTNNINAIELAKNFDMKPIFETARMYKGPPLQQLLDHIYGITSFELG